MYSNEQECIQTNKNVFKRTRMYSNEQEFSQPRSMYSGKDKKGTAALFLKTFITNIFFEQYLFFEISKQHLSQIFLFYLCFLS